MKKIIAVLMALSLVSTVSTVSMAYQAKIKGHHKFFSVFPVKCNCKINTNNADIWNVCEAGANERGKQMVPGNNTCTTVTKAGIGVGGAFLTGLVVGVGLTTTIIHILK